MIKFSFKKLLLTFAISMFTCLCFNLTNFKTSASLLPQLVAPSGETFSNGLNIITCIKSKGDKFKDDENDKFTYIFSIVNFSELLKKFKNEIDKFKVKAKDTQQNKIVAESNLTFETLEHGEFFKFEMSQDDLKDGIYDFEVFHNEKLVGTFKNIKLIKDDYYVKPLTSEQILEIMDKNIVLDANNAHKKTTDHLQGCFSEDGHELDLWMYADLNDIKKLSEKVEGSPRSSVLKNYDEIIVVYKDCDSGEKKLTKELKKEKHIVEGIEGNEGKTFDLIGFKYNLKNSEIPFGKTYKVEIYDKNKNLIGTMKHDLHLIKNL